MDTVEWIISFQTISSVSICLQMVYDFNSDEAKDS